MRARWLVIAAVHVFATAIRASAEPPPPQELEPPAPPQQLEPPAPPQGEQPPPPQEQEPPLPSPDHEMGPDPEQEPPDLSEPDQESGEVARDAASPKPAEPPTPEVPPTLPVSEARPSPTPTPSELVPELPTVFFAPFRLVVNTVDKGEIIIALKDDDVFVRPEDLETAEISLRAGRFERIEGERLLSLKSLSPPLRYELDERDIALRIFAPVEYLPTTRIDLEPRPPNVDYQTPTSMFLNYAARATHTGVFDVYQELGVNADGNLFLTTMTTSSLAGPRRGMTNYTVNDRETLRRFVFGDSVVGTGSLGSVVTLGGFTLTRSYDLDPYIIKVPGIGYAGSTSTPARLEVYVNGALVRTMDIQPGTFELSNLRVTSGAGQATYVLRDVFGNEQRINDPFYLSSSLLAKGLDEFTYSVGLVRGNMTESWDYGRPALMAHHRYGLHDWLTLGGRAEISEDVLSGGPSATIMTPYGHVDVGLSGSVERNESPGFASVFSYGYLSRVFSTSAYVLISSDHYATVSQPAAFDRIVHEVGGFASVPINTRITASVNGRYSQYRDLGRMWNVGSYLTSTILPVLNGVLSGSFSRSVDGRHVWDLMLTLNYSFRSEHNFAATSRVRNGRPSLNANANRTLPLKRGYSYQVNANMDENHSFASSGLVQYQTQFGRVGTSYFVSEYERLVAAEASGALVLVPGVGLFPSLPVHDAFGVIRVPGVRNVRGFVNNQEVGRTDRHGNLLVPNLLSYYGNRLSIAQEDIPLTHTIASTEMVVAPPQRGAAVATFALTMPHYYRGHIVVQQADRQLVPKYGQIRVLEGQQEIISPLGEGGEFELDGVTAGPHRAWVDFLDGSCAFELAVPSSDETVIEMGEVVCVVP